jgi:glycerol-3-phosphate acyltransferase PlsY
MDKLFERPDLVTALIYALTAIVAYFIGNISTARILARGYGIDITQEGSGNAGATNALRTMGKKAGLFTLLVDMAKGLIVTLAALVLIGNAGEYLGACFVVIGHMWPVVYRFKGGKGVATAVGALLVINPIAAFIALAVVALLTLLTKTVSLAVIVSCFASVTAAFFIDKDTLIFLFPIVVLILIKHIPNMSRLAHGKEPRISLGTPTKEKKAYMEMREKRERDVNYKDEYKKMRRKAKEEKWRE